MKFAIYSCIQTKHNIPPVPEGNAYDNSINAGNCSRLSKRGYRFLLPGRFSTDAVESLFGSVRRILGNPNLGPAHARISLKNLTLSQTLKNMRIRTNDFPDDSYAPLNVLLEISTEKKSACVPFAPPGTTLSPARSTDTDVAQEVEIPLCMASYEISGNSLLCAWNVHWKFKE